MTDDPLFIGYCTPGPYAAEADSLRVSLDALGLQHDIIEVADAGSWTANTHHKPAVIGDFITKYPGRRLVYIDVDAYVICRPALFWRIEADFAACMYHPAELLSGTLYFRANAAAAELVHQWGELCRRYPTTLPDGRVSWDQRCLLQAMRPLVSHRQLKFMPLPHSYCWMIGLSQIDRPDSRPIIMHKEGMIAWKRKPVWAQAATGRWSEVPV